MITLLGTSHISPESIESITEAINTHEPDVVALELDPLRLQSLLQDSQQHATGSLFLKAIGYIQRFLGRQTGVMPGEEMIAAYRQARENNIDIALVDQDIRVTVEALKQLPLKEKIKVGGMLVYGLVGGTAKQFDISSVPDNKLVQESLLRVKVMLPTLHQVLIQDRNTIMAERLQELEQQYNHVLGIVGAGHLEGLQEQLETANVV